MLFNEKIMTYVNVSYHHLRADVNTRTRFDAGASNLRSPNVTDTEERHSFHGIGLGGGVKYKLNKHWLLNISGEWINFTGKTMAGPSLRDVIDEVTITQNIKVSPTWVQIVAGFTFLF
jgi:outer membrane protein W